MAGQCQFNNGLAMFNNSGGMGIDYHARGYRGNAGREEFASGLVFHDTDAAGTDRGQIRLMTKSGDMYPRLSC
jgi:hypothetical protein